MLHRNRLPSLRMEPEKARAQISWLTYRMGVARCSRANSIPASSGPPGRCSERSSRASPSPQATHGRPLRTKTVPGFVPDLVPRDSGIFVCQIRVFSPRKRAKAPEDGCVAPLTRLWICSAVISQRISMGPGTFVSKGFTDGRIQFAGAGTVQLLPPWVVKRAWDEEREAHDPQRPGLDKPLPGLRCRTQNTFRPLRDPRPRSGGPERRRHHGFSGSPFPTAARRPARRGAGYSNGNRPSARRC